MNQIYHINHSSDNLRSRVFILQKSELEKRFDPAFYYELRNNKFEFAHPTKTISRIVKSYSGGTPDKSNPNYWNGDICWASPKDMKDFYLLDTQDKISYEGIKNSSTSIAPIGSVLIVFRSGILQHTLPVSVTKVETSINQDLKVLVPSKDILPEYFATFLKTFEKRILPRIVKHSTTVQSINQEEFNQLSIPIPEIEIQKKIIDINKEAIEFKKQYEAEAEKLLASIDDYLLKELGIILPKDTYYVQNEDFNVLAEPKDKYNQNILLNENFRIDKQNKVFQKGRIFITHLNKITGDRFDPFYHQSKFTANINSIKNGKYPVSPLHEIISGNLVKGTLPKQEEKIGDNPVVQISCINTDGTISLDDILTAKDIFSKEQKLVKGDVLVVITGATIGKIAQWNYDGDFFLGGDIVKFQTNSKADNSFVFHFLRSTPIQIEIKRNITGATNGHLAPSDVNHFPIPIPPLVKQKEIADHITAIRQQAQQLKDKTKEALSLASKEIEHILIGS